MTARRAVLAAAATADRCDPAERWTGPARLADGGFWPRSGPDTRRKAEAEAERRARAVEAEAEGVTTDALPEAEAETIRMQRAALRGWRGLSGVGAGRVGH